MGFENIYFNIIPIVCGRTKPAVDVLIPLRLLYITPPPPPTHTNTVGKKGTLLEMKSF